MEKISTGTIIRTACLVLAFLNAGLALFGKSPLPIDDAMIEQVVSYGAMLITAFAAWWKNNSFTQNAIKADAVLKELKEKPKELTDEEVDKQIL